VFKEIVVKCRGYICGLFLFLCLFYATKEFITTKGDVIIYYRMQLSGHFLTVVLEEEKPYISIGSLRCVVGPGSSVIKLKAYNRNTNN